MPDGPRAPRGAHYRAARAWFGMSRDRVAAGSGLDPLTIGRIENDRASTKAASVDRLAAYWARQGVTFLLDPPLGLRVTALRPRALGLEPAA